MPVKDSYIRSTTRGGEIQKYKQKHGVGPMQQIMRTIKALEERAANPTKTKGTARLAATGRASKMKLEAKQGYTATPNDAFLEAINAVAGMGAGSSSDQA